MSDPRFVPATAADVTDERLLAGEFRAFRTEVRGNLELICNRLLPTLERIEQRLDEQDRWRTEVDRWRRDTDQRIAELERARNP